MHHRLVTLAICVFALIPAGALALDATPAATYQPVTRADLVKLPPQAQANPVINQNTAGTLANAAINGNLPQTGTRVATNVASREAATQIATGTGLSRNNAGTLTNAAINGNLPQAGTRVATNVASREATNALTRSGNVSGQDARAITGAAGALANGNTRGATRVAVGAGQRQATNALTRSGNVSGQDARAITGAAGALANGNTRGATRVAVGAGQRQATNALTRSGNVSGQDARAITGAAGALANGNTRGATNIAVGAGQREASNALTRSGNVSGQDARAITGAAGALANGNTRGATRIAVGAAGRQLSNATGLPSGLTRSLIGGGARALFGGRGGAPSSATFIQKNDYVAETDDGIIRHTADGKLSSALSNAGFGNATRLTLSPEGIIRDASGLITGRKDPKTGQLFNAAGLPIPSNTIIAQRMLANIAQGTQQQPATVAAVGTTASGIPAGFSNSNWDAATRQKEWASLLPAQQASWTRTEQLKQGLQASNFPTTASSPTSAQSIVQSNNGRITTPTL